jgi:hypothetical protein
MATTVARPVKLRADDIFFVTMSVVILCTELLGFAQSYFLRGLVFAPLPSLLLHVHGAAFTSWVTLFVVQSVLVAKRNIRLHRTLGTAGGFLAGLMVILGMAVTLEAVHLGRTPRIFTPSMFIVLNCYGVLVFGALVGWAIVKRNNGPIHKRLMLLATFNLIPPGFARWPFAFIQQHPASIGGSLFVFVLSLILFDLISRRRLYAVTVIGSIAVLSVFPVANILGATAPMHHLAALVTGHS